MIYRKLLLPLIFLSTAFLLTALFWFFRGTSAAIAAEDFKSPNSLLTVNAVQPDTAPNDVSTEITIQGVGFTATISGTSVITTPGVYLGNQEIADVLWGNTTTLSATLPWGLEPGVYPLTVINPNGISATLQNAFTLTNGINVFTTDGPYGGNIIDVDIKPGLTQTLYTVAGYSGLFISEDSGEHWEILRVNVSANSLDFDAGDAQTMYLGSQTQRALRTRDDGENWVPLLPDAFYHHCMDAHPAAHPVNTGVVYLGVGNCDDQIQGVGPVGVYQSTNYGADWITKTNGITDTNIQAIAINPQNPLTMLAGTVKGNVYVSFDGAENWTLSANLGKPIKRIFFNPYEAQQAWVFSRDTFAQNELFRSTNLSDWDSIAVDTNGSANAGLDFLPGSIWVAGGNLYFSTDGGDHWNEINNFYGEANTLAIDPAQPQVIYLGSDMGLEKSFNGGTDWQEINQGLSGMFPLSLAASSGEIETVYAKTYQGIYRSFNGGNTWENLYHGKGGNTRSNLKVDPFAPNRVYYGPNCPDEFCLDLSMDYGNSWNIVTTTVPITYLGNYFEVSAIAPHPQTSGRILAGLSVNFPGFNPWVKSLGFVYVSDDYGENWSQIAPTLVVSRVEKIVYDAVDPDLVYMGTDGSGMWKSTDGGLTWQVTPYPEGNQRAMDIAPHPNLYGHLILRAINETQDGGTYVSQDAGDSWTLLDGGELGKNYVGGLPLIYTATFPPTLYGFMFISTEFNLGRSLDEGQTWEVIPGAPWPEALDTVSDGERVVLYVGSPGNLGSSAGAQMTNTSDNFLTASNILGGGVYRLTTLLPTEWVYLPLVNR